jgi:hypothetical protein
MFRSYVCPNPARLKLTSHLAHPNPGMLHFVVLHPNSTFEPHPPTAGASSAVPNAPSRHGPCHTVAEQSSKPQLQEPLPKPPRRFCFPNSFLILCTSRTQPQLDVAASCICPGFLEVCVPPNFLLWEACPPTDHLFGAPSGILETIFPASSSG